MRKVIYQAVTERLHSLTDTDGNAIIRQTGLWNNALSADNAEVQETLPAVFIEFAPIQWKSVGGRRLATQVEMRLHILTPQTATEEEALKGFYLPEQIAGYLCGWKDDRFDSFIRSGSHTNYDNHRMREEVESYLTTIR